MDVQDQPVSETPLPAAAPVAPVEDSSSLSDHEAQFGPGADRDPVEDAELDGAPAAGERDGRGRYRSKGSRATADDVPRIQALTKQARTAEAERDALKAERDALKSTAPASTPSQGAALSQTPRATVQPPIPQQAIPQQFPEYEEILQIPGNENVSFNQYFDARQAWVYRQLREQERLQEAAEKSQRDYQQALTTHQKNLKTAMDARADWSAVVTPDLPWTRVLDEAVVTCKNGGEALYYLCQNRDELADLVKESLEYSSSAVAAMRRYLDKAIAPVSTPARNAAATTGSALALVPPPAPRPPNPVRTGTQTPADAAPGDDDMSLAAHERHFSRPRR